MSKTVLISLISLSLIFSSCVKKKSYISDDSIVVDSIGSIIEEDSTIVKRDSLGVWSITNYVNEFGEQIKDRFIFGTFSGRFSNSATENSKLNIHIMIDSESQICIKLFEYASNNPVKSGIEDHYKIKVKSSDNSTCILYANNYSDRLELNKKDSKKLSSMLKKGGKVAFYIVEISEYSGSTYNFEIFDASGYDKALLQLKKKK